MPLQNIVILLSWLEWRVAVAVGAERRIESIKASLNKNKHAEKSDWATDVDGVAAEMAFAKYLGVYYEPTVNTFKEPDVLHYHVRSTCLNHGQLILRDNDDPAGLYILCITNPPHVCLVGMLLGANGMLPKWRGEGCLSNAWWVGQKELEDLPMRIAWGCQ